MRTGWTNGWTLSVFEFGIASFIERCLSVRLEEERSTIDAIVHRSDITFEKHRHSFETRTRRTDTHLVDPEIWPTRSQYVRTDVRKSRWTYTAVAQSFDRSEQLAHATCRVSYAGRIRGRMADAME